MLHAAGHYRCTQPITKEELYACATSYYSITIAVMIMSAVISCGCITLLEYGLLPPPTWQALMQGHRITRNCVIAGTWAANIRWIRRVCCLGQVLPRAPQMIPCQTSSNHDERFNPSQLPFRSSCTNVNRRLQTILTCNWRQQLAGTDDRLIDECMHVYMF